MEGILFYSQYVLGDVVLHARTAVERESGRWGDGGGTFSQGTPTIATAKGCAEWYGVAQLGCGLGLLSFPHTRQSPLPFSSHTLAPL